jgi:Right handed beta helix region/Protein of unknown function (DUF1565)
MKTVFLLLSFLSIFSCSFAQYQPISEGNLKTFYVSPEGKDTNSGDSQNPYRTIQKAIGTALYFKRQGTGTKVIVAAGIYRENTNQNYTIQINSGIATNNSAPLVLEGAGWNVQNPKCTKDVILSGSEDFVGGWTKNADGTWSKDWNYAFGVPSKGVIPFGVSDAFLRREALFVNGQMYFHINPPNYTNKNGKAGNQSEAELASTFNVNGGRLLESEGAFWVEDAVLKDGKVEKVGKITVQLPKDLPADFDLNSKENVVEVTTKKGILQTWLGSQSEIPTNIVIRNFVFQHGGSNSYIQHQNNLLIEDCIFNNHKRIALSVNTNKNVLVRRIECNNNGEGGATFNGVQDAEIVDCMFNNNARQSEILGYQSWSVCGVKFYTTKGDNKNIKMIRCQANRNKGTGFWWDTGNVLCKMIDCKGNYNSTMGAFIECNNNPDNNYENIEKEVRENTGIPTLRKNYSVMIDRCVLAHNMPSEDTKPYRNVKGRGIFISENENLVVKNSLIFDNEIQISTYDNRRGENRNFQFNSNIIAAQNLNQRLYAVGSYWDSKEIFDVPEANGSVAAKIKGGWYGLFDELSHTTNDNIYFYPEKKAFNSREQRFGTAKWDAKDDSGKPKLTIEEWRNEHLNNLNNKFNNKAVDSRSILKNIVYETPKPLLIIEPDTLLTEIGSYQKRFFTVSRVTDQKLNQPFSFNYKIIVESNAPDYQNGKNIINGTLKIASWNTSIGIKIDVSQFKGLTKNDKIRIEIDSTSTNYFIIGASKVIALTDIENERILNKFDKNTPTSTIIHTNSQIEFEIKVRINEAVKKVKLENVEGLDIPLTEAILNENQYSFKPILPLGRGKYELKLKTEKENLKYVVEVK